MSGATLILQHQKINRQPVRKSVYFNGFHSLICASRFDLYWLITDYLIYILRNDA